ncbi:MAG TPA: LCP family protein [Streptosporangiaceae bacterium]|nr:LCP family protein [Streptosporangiaceae bacterium]
MSEWPEGWFRNDPSRVPPRSGGGQPAGPADPTVRLSGSGAGAGQSAGSPADYARTSQLPDQLPGQQPGGSPWPEQPPARTGRTGRRTGWRRPGRWVKLIAGLLGLILIVAAILYFYLDSKLQRQNVLVDYPGRPAASAGQNWLITGSDSRQGLSRAQMRQYSTGRGIGGHRSDTIMLLHVPSNGTRTVLISIPRDSYVRIPGYGYNKINAAFAFGGPRLLAETVQNLTGLRIDHYMGIGFGGFVNVVDAIGGVRMCLPARLDDRASGLHLRKGCQTLSGGQALSYVRDRHSFANQDLQRVQDQRLFVKSLLSKLTSTGTLLNPFASVPAAFGAAQNLYVDSGTHLYQLVHVAFALRNPESTTVPIANPGYSTSAGDAVLLDAAAARQLFDDLRADRPVPRRLLAGSRAG